MTKTIAFILLLICMPIHAPSQSLVVDGDDDFVDVMHDPALAVSGDMTIEAWIYIDSYPTTPAEIANKKRRNPYEGFFFHLQNGFVEFGGYSTTSSGANTRQVSVPWAPVIPGQWTHIAGTITGGTYTILINGQEAGTATHAGGITGSPTNTLRIGHDCESPTNNSHAEFEGRIDEVRYWSYGRTPTQVQALMNQEADNLPGLVAAWHFNGNALDLTGSHNGTLYGDASFIPQSPFFCQNSTTCLSTSLPITLGTTATLSLSSPSPTAPLTVLIDTTLGQTPLGSYGTSNLAFSPSLFAITDWTGTFGPGLTSSLTTPTGSWSFSLPIPNDPSLLNLTLHSEAFVFDFLAPNNLFHQSNTLTITFQ